jgi:adenosylhomocysteine nucleosidase
MMPAASQPSPGLAIIAALPREIAALVKGARPDRSLLVRGIHHYRLPGAVVVAAGMGASRATLAVESALLTGGVTMLVSAGLAGSCSPQIAAGAIVEATQILDTHTGERYTTMFPQGDTRLLATTSTIASVHEKARLLATYDAAMVDMEAAAIARLATAHGVWFRAIKAISDAHDFELASLGRFSTPHGHFRTGAFALHTALRPHRWRKTMHLGGNSNRALAALTSRLREVIAASSQAE